MHRVFPDLRFKGFIHCVIIELLVWQNNKLLCMQESINLKEMASFSLKKKKVCLVFHSNQFRSHEKMHQAMPHHSYCVQEKHVLPK